jgi:pyridoxine 5-phosphate synthase
MVKAAADTGANRIELYTEAYASGFAAGKGNEVIQPYIQAAELAGQLGLGVNAGHDLDLQNLRFFADHVPGLLEVSIGHALICDAIYLGLENTVQLYQRCLRNQGTQ